MSMNLTHSQYLNLLARTLVKRLHPRIAIDVGCGRGEIVKAFQKLGVETYGIDMSKQALYSAKEAALYPLLCRADAQNMPFKENRFDLVFSSHVIEHLKNPCYFIKECKRILRPDGTVFITMPVSPSGLTKLWKALKLQREPDHISMYSRFFWIKAFEKEGFVLIGDLQEIVKNDPPLHFVGQFLLDHGSIGKWLCLRLMGYIRASFLFKFEARDYKLQDGD